MSRIQIQRVSKSLFRGICVNQDGVGGHLENREKPKMIQFERAMGLG